MEISIDLLLLLLPLIGAGAGAYLGAYLKKKGENLATHEDLQKLVDQMAAITKATKEIEAQISDAVWNRQRRWDAKKEAVFEAIKALGEVEGSLSAIAASYSGWHGQEQPDLKLHAWELAQKAHAIYDQASRSFGRASALARLVCGVEVAFGFSAVNLVIIDIASKALNGELPANKEWARLASSLVALNVLIKKDLGLSEATTIDTMSQSSESSAVQAPAPQGPISPKP
jgi:hypothetical protein